MPVVNPTVTDIYQVANQIFAQALGGQPLGTVTAENFVTVAQHALANAYDPLINSISQVLSKTIFAERPYDEKFRGMEADSLTWGNWLRKINFGYEDPATQQRYLNFENGESVDQFVVFVPPVYETAFYGQDVLTWVRTIKRTGLEPAFRSASELEQFIASELLYTANNIKQQRENLKRGLLANTVASKVAADTDNVIHLLTEYNKVRGLTGDSAYTATTILNPDVYGDFIRWVYGRIASLCQLMTERSLLFHMNPTGVELPRQTRYRDQRIYLLAQGMNTIQANVLSMTFKDQYLQLPYTELVNFWQNIQTPDQIAIAPFYTGLDGQPVTGAETVEQANVFGVIMDRDACMINFYADRQNTTVYNAAQESYNIWWRQNYQFGFDITENAVVLLMD